MLSHQNTLAETKPTEAPFEAHNPHHPRFTIKHGSTFLVCDEQGMVRSGNNLGYGLYSNDTRWLNQLSWTLNERALVLLNSSFDDGFAAFFEYSNPRLDKLPEQSVLVRRDLAIDEQYAEKLTVTNYHHETIQLALKLRFAADFKDMFEVRGEVRKRRGKHLGAIIDAGRNHVTLGYRGLDRVSRRTRLDFSLACSELSESAATFVLNLAPQESATLEVCTSLIEGEQTITFQRARPYAAIDHGAREAWQEWLDSGATIHTSDADVNALLARSANDIYILRQQTPSGMALSAGLPWFACPFGRDSAITAMQTLAFQPSLAREVILLLGAHQATREDPVLDARPGKIMHELRFGEMAKLKEIAFRPYYGTVDATQLWLMLIHQYFKWTGDAVLVRRLWTKIRRAINFLVEETGDDYIRYGGAGALTNRGWKDSGNSIVHDDGTLAPGPIALCEAQAYVFSAWNGIADIAAMLGKKRFARELRSKSAELQARFARDFWLPAADFVALALDGNNKPCAVISSNPGHVIGTGILDREKETLVARRLMVPDMFGGWALRTLASSETAYQPLDYQRGAYWPHDSGIAAVNMCIIGRPSDAHKILEGLVAVSRLQPDKRLPELFAGFERKPGLSPTRYPVACFPQAWAAGTIFHILFGCMGLEPDAANRTLTIRNPSLPEWLGNVKVTGLRVGDSTFDLSFGPTNEGKSWCTVKRRSGTVKWIITS